MIYTIINVYSPNQDQLQFLSMVSTRLKRFSTVNMILGGDLNAALIPRLDTSMGKSSISPASLTKIRTLLSDLSLVDVWRILHPTTKDFTYYFPAHSNYSRLDYMFISQSLLDFSPTASIGLTLWSDHAPIHMSLGSIPTQKKESHMEIKWQSVFGLGMHPGHHTNHQTLCCRPCPWRHQPTYEMGSPQMRH